LAKRIGTSTGESFVLLLARHREPQLEQLNTAAHESGLESRRLAKELGVLARGAEPHHILHAGAVVPRAVEHYDLAGRRQVGNVPLEVPLRTFGFAWLGQGHYPPATWVHVFGDPLDRATLASRVAALEQDHDSVAGLLDRSLSLEQFDLQPFEFLLVLLLCELLVVGRAMLHLVDTCGNRCS
jgi:hypothetical protein